MCLTFLTFLIYQEDNSSLELRLEHLVLEGIQRLQGNQACLVGMDILRVGLHWRLGVQTHTPARMVVHLKAMEEGIILTRRLPGCSLLIPRMREKVEIVGFRCEAVNLGNYHHHVWKHGERVREGEEDGQDHQPRMEGMHKGTTTLVL